jgi:hypothetical protein
MYGFIPNNKMFCYFLRQTAARFGISDKGTVSDWLVIYNREGAAGLHAGQSPRSLSMIKEKPKAAKPEMPATEHERLLVGNEYLRTAVACLKNSRP